MLEVVWTHMTRGLFVEGGFFVFSGKCKFREPQCSCGTRCCSCPPQLRKDIVQRGPENVRKKKKSLMLMEKEDK